MGSDNTRCRYHSSAAPSYPPRRPPTHPANPPPRIYTKTNSGFCGRKEPTLTLTPTPTLTFCSYFGIFYTYIFTLLPLSRSKSRRTQSWTWMQQRIVTRNFANMVGVFANNAVICKLQIIFSRSENFDSHRDYIQSFVDYIRLYSKIRWYVNCANNTVVVHCQRINLAHSFHLCTWPSQNSRTSTTSRAISKSLTGARQRREQCTRLSKVYDVVSPGNWSSSIKHPDMSHRSFDLCARKPSVFSLSNR